jgi:hypothetical protein
MKEKEKKSYTPYIVIAIVAGFVIYKTWQFANKPDALEQALEFLGGVAICLGAFVLFMVVVLIAPSLANEFQRKPLPRPAGLQYEVNAARTKPAVESWEGYGLIGGGVLYTVFSFGLSYLYIGTLIAEIGGIRTIRDINLLEVCGGLFVVLCTLASGIFAVFMMASGISTSIRNRKWMRGTAKACATIVDRQVEETITAFDYKYGGSTLMYKLILQVDDQPGVPEFDGRFIRADVSKRTFNRYARKDGVIIHYATHSPLTFILRGE